jgi:hypothetical protein
MVLKGEREMTKSISLPLQVKRFASMRFVAPLTFLAVVFGTGYIWYLFSELNLGMRGLGIMLIVLSPFLVPALVLSIFLIKHLKATNITIDRTSLTISRVGITGFNTTNRTSRSINEFHQIDVETGSSITPTGIWFLFFRIIFRTDSRDRDVIFDPPYGCNPREFAQNLGRLLNLKVNT